MKVFLFEYGNEREYSHVQHGEVYYSITRTSENILINTSDMDRVLYIGDFISFENKVYKIRGVVHNLDDSIKYYIDRGIHSPNIVDKVEEDYIPSEESQEEIKIKSTFFQRLFIKK